MKPEIQQRFDNAAQYDAAMGKTFASYSTLHLTVLSYLSVKLRANAHVLDVGCGTGTSLITYATHQPAWTLVGVDPAETMIGLAQAKIDELSMSARIKVQQGDISDLPHEAVFDAATLILVEHLLPDDGTKLALFKGIADRVKRGGWMILAGLYADFNTPESQLGLAAWTNYATFQGFPEEARQNLQRRATVEDSLIPASRIRELLGEAGFHNPTQIYQVHLLGGWLAQRA